jgi:uncharacterized protein (DUF924 family)
MAKTDTAELKQALRDIHAYWFGKLKSRTSRPAPATSQKWFAGGKEVDDEIRERFGAALAPLAQAKWDFADLSDQELIGLVVLLDQFPRNLYRGKAESFAFDPTARALARKLIKGDHRRFAFVERFFLYLPFEHSEDIADQDLSVQLFGELAVEAPKPLKDLVRAALDFATRHRDVIRKFGRYPHRNKMLKRTTNAKEREFLKATPMGF